MLTGHIFDWAERKPDKTAIVFSGEPWSYRSFAESIAVARGYFARREWVGGGVAVLAVSNLRDFWVLSLALRSLGLTTTVASSIEAIGALGLPDVRCVIASAAESWPGLEAAGLRQGFTLVSVSLDGEASLGLGAISPPSRPGGHIMQTSGTTGINKKVLIDPSFEAAFMRRRWEIIEADHDSVVAVFDFAAWTGVGYRSPAAAWFAGATVVIEQGEGRHRALLHPGLTHATVVPDMLASILAAPPDAFPRNENMRLSVTAGTITQAQIDQTKARITPRVYNWLGATEGQIMAFTPLDTPDDHRWHRLVPGGGVEIVDELDRPVRIGEVGQVRLSTAGGPPGYLHDEAATRAFFKDGFFYPGDLAVMRADGRMALQGRVTSVINVSGHKISPEPIEDHLRETFGVSGACLFSLQDEHGEEELHLVIESPTPIDAEILTPALRRELHGFTGVRVRYVAALPRNAMGKVLRKAVTAQALADRSRPPLAASLPS